MQTVTDWTEVTLNAFLKIGEQLSSNLLNVLGAVIILVLGWLITKLITFILGKVLEKSKIDGLSKKLNESKSFGNSKIEFDLSKVILAFVKWILYLVFLTVAADILNWTVISNEITNLLAYLPRLFSALALLIIGLYIANFIKKAIKGFLEAIAFSGAGLVSSIIFFIITIIFILTALNQAGIDISVITGNLIIIVGGVVLTLVISLGVGSIELVQKSLYTYYVRRNYSTGDQVTFKNKKGTILSIGNLTVVIASEEGELHIPIKDFANEVTIRTK
ncbi:MAG: mechanosensitive ion channel family protein [Cecembia sp.]